MRSVRWGLFAALLCFTQGGFGAGFTISGATVTLANSAQLSTGNDIILSSGGLVANVSNILVGGNWTNTGGTFTAGTSTVTFNAGALGKTITNRGFPFYNIYFNGASGYWTLQDSMTVTSTATFANGTFDTNAAISTSVVVSGDWNSNGATLALNNSTVTFAGAGTSTSTLRGSTTFYSLSCIIPGKVLMMAINSTQTVSNLLTLTGASGNQIMVKSTVGASYGYLNSKGSNNVTFVNALDNNASGGETILAGASSTNGGHTSNWLFAAPTLSVTFSTGAYNFGFVNLAATTVSTVAVTVNNAGTATENYALSVTTTGAQTVWAVGTATPTVNDTFALFGLFNSVQPSTFTFLSSDVIISTPTASTSGIYAGNQNGVHVPVGNNLSFWMCMYTPATTSTAAAQQMNVVISASAP